MHIADSLVAELLVRAGKLKEKDVDALIADGHKNKMPVQEIAIKKQMISEKDLTKLYAKEIDVPFVELEGKKLDKMILARIPERTARKYNAVLYAMDGDVPKLAMDDPDDLQAIDFLQKELGQSMEISIATTKDILSALDEYKGEIGNEISKVVSSENTEEDPKDQVEETEDISEDSPIAQTVNLLVQYAIKQKASDVHIEPRENVVQVRYRIDGVLREANKLPRKISGALVSRIKILANLKIDEHRAMN